MHLNPNFLPWTIQEEDHLGFRAYSIWDCNNDRVCVGCVLVDAQAIVDAMNANTPTPETT